MAETLDRSRNGVVRTLTVRERGKAVRLQVAALGDSELEIWAANKALPALDHALKRSFRIESRHLKEPDVPARRSKAGTRRPRASAKSRARKPAAPLSPATVLH